MKISVAVAAYNGEGYILEQLASILNQLAESDEVIVSVDPCADNTYNVVKGLAELDSRIKLLEGPGKGLIKNFENALRECMGDVIFLSDQDDKWLPEKTEVIKKHFEAGADLVLHNCVMTDSQLHLSDEKTFFEFHGSKPGFLANIVKNSYMGCCMAFRSEIKDMALPFPDKIPMHDQWIGLIAERCGAKIVFEDKPLLLYRRHGSNASAISHAGLLKMTAWRFRVLNALKNMYKD